MKPEWWPENPYPESVFPMTTDEYCEAVPDGDLRTAISGCLGRVFWDVASEDIFIRMCEAVDARVIGIELGPTRLKCALLPLDALQQGIAAYVKVRDA